MLLTSSQVSVAISSFIVFVFTLALFLSGYVLQQHTLRDLREAIKPQLVRPASGQPELYLPPQFRDDPAYTRRGVVDAIAVNLAESEAEKEQESMVGATRWQKEARRKKLLEEANAKQIPINEENKDEVEKSQPSEGKPPTLSAAERRKRIKEQILAEGEGEGFKGYRRRMW